MKNLLYKDYTEYDFLRQYQVLTNQQRILNAGSSSVRYGGNCVNIDIQEKPNVDVVCDLHALPTSLGQFDAIICNAVLQYCHTPPQAISELYRVLKPGGYLFVDTPWIQPYANDTPDKFRFSQDALKMLFANFEIIQTGSSIRSGSAFLLHGQRIARNLTKNKYLNFGLAKLVTLMLFPCRWVKTADESRTAGAFYIICRKPATDRELLAETSH